MTIANLATATPVEIDTELGRLYTEAAPYRQQIEAINERMFELLGDSSKREAITTYAHAEDRARELAEELPKLVSNLDKARASLRPLRDAEQPLEDEHGRRRWSRFFLVVSSDGHVHSSMHCSTCNPRTQYMWMPELSGLTMDEAIAVMDKRGSAEILCTVCFPNAPVARTVAQVPDTQCPGSGTWDYPRETARLGYYTGNFGICRHCGQAITVSSTGKMRKHDKTPAGPSDDVVAKAATKDGSPLKVNDNYGHTETFKTERAAMTWVVRSIGCHREYKYELPAEGIQTVIAALAEKHGKTVEQVTEEIEPKVVAWIKREKRR